MGEDRDRDSILAMKSHGLIGKIGKWAGVAGAVIGLLSQIIPPIWDAVIGDDIMRLRSEVSGLRGELETQKKLLRAAVQATDDRIESNEREHLELEGSIRLIGAEVRLRHGANVDDTLPIYRSLPRSRSGRLRIVAEENDERLSGERRSAGGSLVEDMRRQGAPVDALKLDR